MPSAPDLERIQRLFWSLITAPEGVEPGARELAASGRLPAADLSFLVRGDERLGPSGRLDIYANMYFYRLRDCLAEDFPKTAAVAGGARFHNLITDYLLAHPSSFWSLRDVGRELPGFLRGHPLGEERPFLADLARLEWARADVFDEQDAEPVARARVAALRGEEIGTLRVGLIPAFRLLELEWAVAPVWRRVEDLARDPGPGETNSAAVGERSQFEERPPAAIDPPERRPSYVRVWRKEFRVYHRSIEADEAACLQELSARGATLPRLGEAILERLAPGAGEKEAQDPTGAAARRLTALMDRWLEDGILRAASP